MTTHEPDGHSDAVLGPQGAVRAVVGVILGAVLGGVLALLLPRDTGEQC